MKWILLLLGIPVLASCLAAPPAVVGERLPPYVVLLTASRYAFRCTGVMTNSQIVVVASHCANKKVLRVLTQYGEENTQVKTVLDASVYDVAILKLGTHVLLPSYATFASPDLTQPAFVFGACPEYLLNIPRPIYSHPQDGVRFTKRWFMTDPPICGGDSGGPAIQSGHVIGMVSSVGTVHTWLVPTELIQDTLSRCDVC